MSTKKNDLFGKMLLLIVIMVFFIPSFSGFSYAANREGLKVKVITKNKNIFTGELLKISGRNLILYDKTKNKSLTVPIGELKKLSVIKKKMFERELMKLAIFDGSQLIFILLNRDDSDDYYLSEERKHVQIAPLLAPIVGAVLAMIDSSDRTASYPIDAMSVSEIEVLLADLDRSTRENVIFKNPGRKGFFNRIGVYWKPHTSIIIHDKSSFKCPGELVVLPGSNPGDSPVTGSFDMKGRFDNMKGGPVGITYAVRERFSLGLEYSKLGNYSMGGYSYLEVKQGEDYYYYWHVGAGWNLKPTMGLVTANFEILPAVGRSTKLWFETGIGINISCFESYLYKYSTDNFSLKNFKVVRPAFKIGFALDLYAGDSLSTGFYVDYIYAMSSFPGYKTSGTIRLESYSHPGAIERNAELNIGKASFNTGGIFLGIFIRFH